MRTMLEFYVSVARVSVGAGESDLCPTPRPAKLCVCCIATEPTALRVLKGPSRTERTSIAKSPRRRSTRPAKVEVICKPVHVIHPAIDTRFADFNDSEISSTTTKRYRPALHCR